MSTTATESKPSRTSSRSGGGRGGKGRKSSAKTKRASAKSKKTAARSKRASAKSQTASSKTTNKDGGKRLSPGQLDGMVLGYMKKNRGKLPVTAGTVGRGIKRSSGAVANCLARFEKAGKVKLTSKKPREYSLIGDSK